MVFRRNFKRIRDEFVAIRAERKLQEVVAGICQEMTPGHLRVLAHNNVSLQSILEQTGRKVPKPSAGAKLGIDYLAELSTARLLEILAEVVPEHVAVLRQYPDYAETVCRDLKMLAGAGHLTNKVIIS